MDAARRVLKVLAICCLCNMASHARPTDPVDGPDAGKGPVVTIELTKLEVTDSFLELSYRVSNSSNHEVWVCSEVNRPKRPFEMFLKADKQTLLIRKRLAVPTPYVWHRPPDPGTYARLSPGTTHLESLRIDLPAAGQFMYAGQTTEVIAQTVRRLVLEIGYHDEDLPALARSICAIANQFSDEGWKLYTSRVDPNMWHTYFRGLTAYGTLLDFEMINKDAASKGYAYVDYSYEALAEKVLRMEINGVAIPYEGRIEKEFPAPFPAASD